MSLIIDATKAAERERERRAQPNGGAVPLLIPLRSSPQPEFSWRRAAMLGAGGAALLAAGWIAFVKISDTRRQPLALVSPPPIADVVAAGTPADTAATPAGDSSIAAEPQAIAQSRPASSVATPPRRVASAGAAPVATAGRDSAGAPRDSAAENERPREGGGGGQLRIAVDAREMNLSQIFALAVAAHRAGDLSQAATGYERVLAVDGNHVDALNNMGVLLSAMRNYDRAELLLRRAVRLSPRNAGAWNNLGTALAQRGQTAEAIAAYQQALSIEPQHVTARVSLAQQYLAIGSRVESRQLLEAVLSSNPAVPEAYYTLGQVHELEQDWPAAISAYNAFIRLAPGRLQEHVASVRRRVDALSARVR